MELAPVLYLMGLMDNCFTFKSEIFSTVFLGSNFFLDTLLAQFLTLNGMGGVHPLEVFLHCAKTFDIREFKLFGF